MLSVFAGTLGPVVSHLIFGYGFTGIFAWVLGITVGIILGFFVIPIARHLLKFHDGFNLYNIGFASGIIGIVFVSVMKSLGYPTERVVLLYQSHDSIILALLFISCLYLMTVGYFAEEELIKKWKLILPISGRAISDFTEPAGFGWVGGIEDLVAFPSQGPFQPFHRDRRGVPAVQQHYGLATRIARLMRWHGA
jgi:hypothetical protein